MKAGGHALKFIVPEKAGFVIKSEHGDENDLHQLFTVDTEGIDYQDHQIAEATIVLRDAAVDAMASQDLHHYFRITCPRTSDAEHDEDSDIAALTDASRNEMIYNVERGIITVVEPSQDVAAKLIATFPVDSPSILIIAAEEETDELTREMITLVNQQRLRVCSLKLEYPMIGLREEAADVYGRAVASYQASA